MTMLGNDDVALLLFHASLPHELQSSAVPGSLQESGWELFHRIQNTPSEFADPSAEYSNVALGGSIPTEDDAEVLLMAAG